MSDPSGIDLNLSDDGRGICCYLSEAWQSVGSFELVGCVEGMLARYFVDISLGSCHDVGSTSCHRHQHSSLPSGPFAKWQDLGVHLTCPLSGVHCEVLVCILGVQWYS